MARELCVIRKRRRLVERVADSKPRFAWRLASLLERQPEELRAAEAVAALMLDFKPVLEGIFMDDEGRLWVQHGNIYTVGEDELDVPYVVRGAVGR